MSDKLPYIEYDYEFETITESQIVTTDCASFSLLNQGNCSFILDNKGTIPIGGGLTVALNGAMGIPRFNRRISIVFKNDNAEMPQKKQVLIVRTLITNVCYE